MSTRRALRCAYCLLALALAATTAGSGSRAEQDMVSTLSPDDVARSGADDSALDREIEELRRVLVRSEETRRNARALLESASELSRGWLDGEQAHGVTEAEGHGDDVAPITEDEKARRTARAEEYAKAIAQLRAAVAAQDAEHARLESEIAALERERNTQARQRAATPTARDAYRVRLAEQERELAAARAVPQTPQAKQPETSAIEDQKRARRENLSEAATPAHSPPGRPTPRELGEDQPAQGPLEPSRRESEQRIAALEAEVREARDRERARQAEAKELQQALLVEQQTFRSKLEALQSVLQNVRNAGAGLRAELDDARRKNAELSQRVGELKEAVLKVHALREDYARNEFQSPTLATASGADQKRRERSSPEGPTYPSTGPKISRAPTTATAARPTQSVAPEPEALQTPSVADADSTADLREQLSVERERRETLEQEIQRLTASGNAEERFVEAWKALQAARSEILVLSTQLSDERKSREDLEVQLARLQHENEKRSTSDAAQQLGETLQQRRADADRLGEQLKNANEIIVRLKGRLEAAESPAAESKIASDLEKENDDLRGALKAAQEATTSLRAKAEMAERLAEMVYGNTP